LMKPIGHWYVITRVKAGLRVMNMTPELRQEILTAWRGGFQELKENGPEGLPLWKAAGLYAVASICYDEGNHSPLIEDELFDRLCKWLYLHFDEAVAEGADKLDRKLLSCGSGVDTKIFVEAYHAIAEVLLGHVCRCVKCRA